jgi:hypothetical protein
VTSVVAYPADRQRLLDNGEMRMPVYSSQEPADAARAAYRIMNGAAELMGLALSEPVLETGLADGHDGRTITVRCGVSDALAEDQR